MKYIWIIPLSSAIGIILALGTLSTAGSGHGSLWPIAVVFGLLAMLVPISELSFIVIGSLYYIIAIAVAYNGFCHRNKILCISVFITHWISVLLVIWQWRLSLFNDPLNRIWNALCFQPQWFVAVVVVFLALNISLFWILHFVTNEISRFSAQTRVAR